MTGQKRCCATCRFFYDANMSGSGWCTHPKRKLTSDAQILVRKQELACRNSWGFDYYAEGTFGEDDSMVGDAVASSSGPAPERAADQMRQPDNPTQPESQSQPLAASRVHGEDISHNPDANREQEDRAEVMRQGPRDAIMRARERSLARRLGKGRAETNPPAVQTGQSPDEPGDDRIVARGSTPRPEADERPDPIDRVIQRDPVQPTTEDREVVRTGTVRQPASPVPAAEIAAGPRRDSDARYFEIPEIKPDVELPLLRNNFRLPGTRANGTRSQGTADASTVESKEMTAYERALQRAREYRAETSERPILVAESRSNASPGNRSASTDRPYVATGSRAASLTPNAWNEPGLPESENDKGDDEVVAFHADRDSGLGRFAAPVEYVDEVSEDALEDDFELDRSFRPEETETQSGQRWWRTFGRHRVFNHSSEGHLRSERSEPGEVEASRVEPFFDDEVDDSATPVLTDFGDNGYARDPEPDERDEDLRVAPTAFDINWDDTTLAPVKPQRSTQAVPTRSTHAWSSLNYLDDADDSDSPLEPLAWTQIAGAERAQVSRSADPRSPRALPDPTSQEGMDIIRDRLFGAVREPARPASETQPIRTHRPMTRNVVQATGRLESGDRGESLAVSRPAPVEDEPGPRIADPAPVYDYDSEFNPDFDIRKIAAQQSDPPLDMRIEISPDIPRKCATCRDFRPSENGQRGWCTNDWAFSHKQLVNADDLPCDSTIGCWWLPALEEWDRDEFLAQLNRRTPRTDRLLAELYGTRRASSG
jgi:hypothetical protein